MLARFIGTHGSMGLIYGKMYQIIEINNRGPYPIAIQIITQGKSVICTYNSLTNFLNNWKVNQ